MHRVDGHRLHFRQQLINRKLYRPCPKTFQGCRGCLRCSLDEIFMGVPASVWAAYGLGTRLVALVFSSYGCAEFLVSGPEGGLAMAGAGWLALNVWVVWVTVLRAVAALRGQ